MIESFGNPLAKDYLKTGLPEQLGSSPPGLKRSGRRKLLYLHEAVELKDLKAPPGNRLEALKGKWKGHYSIRINNQWRIVFQWNAGNAYEARVIDYH